MMAIAAAPKPKGRRFLTYAEVLAEFPKTTRPVEFCEGQMIVSPSPGPDYQLLVKGTHALHSKAMGSALAASTILSGFKFSFSALESVIQD